MRPAAFAMRWGYLLPDGRRIINARSETAAERLLFRDGILRRRCAIPATNYYEWERIGGRRIKYAIRPVEGQLFYMAGIYRMEADGPVFSILTRQSADSIAFIHDRMPVILPRDLVEDWTDPAREADEILDRAVLEVRHEKQIAAEQVSMDL
ncbi:MAG: SOS response-associated peptidase [Clostridia bacterium]|nr:SOS response-associated peptidase [Clostridia bacterium]